MTSLSLFPFMHWRRKWQPTPVFLSGESHGRRSLMDFSPWGRKRVRQDLATKKQNQFSSVAQSCPILCDPTDCSTPGLPVHHQLPEPLKLMSIELVMPSNHLILCRPLLLPSVFPSIRVFSNESVLIRWPKYWSFSFSISPSKEYSGLI